jgi:hypothetical protein
VVRRRPRAIPHDDLFELFADLPRPRRRAASAQRERILHLVAAARVRAAQNVRRQLEASAHVRAVVAARRLGGPNGRRRSTIS